MASDQNMEIKQSFIEKQIHQTYATVSDWLNAMIFHSSETTTSGLYLNQKLSNAMTNLFVNTKINVMIISSKTATIFTLPGAPKTSSAFNGLLTRFYNYVALIPLIGAFESLLTAIQIKGAGDDIDHLSYDESTKKLKINLEEITIYISSGLIDILSNDDEIIAILLSEVGQNINLSRRIIDSLIFGGSFATVTVGALIGIITKITHDDSIKMYGNYPFFRNEISERSKPFFYIAAFTIITGIFGYFYSVYRAKKTQQYSDEFAVKCGYGAAFNSAIRKAHAFIFDSSTHAEAVRGMNFFDRVLHFLIKIGAYISNFFSNIGIIPALSTGTRERLAANANSRITPITANSESRNYIIERFKRNAVISHD